MNGINGETLLRVRGLRVELGGHAVLNELSFEVQKGQMLCVVGENGSGKSTLVRALLGLIPAAKGQITLCGVRREQIGYLPQQNTSLTGFPASVYEVVLSGTVNRLGCSPFYSHLQRKRAQEALAYVGISELAQRAFSELSGGQQQRTLLARALCAADRMLLLDEPANGLDPLAVAQFYDTVKKLHREDSMTVLMVSHDIRTCLSLADRVLHLGPQEWFFGSVQEYQDSKLGYSFAHANAGRGDDGL